MKTPSNGDINPAQGTIEAYARDHPVVAELWDSGNMSLYSADGFMRPSELCPSCPLYGTACSGLESQQERYPFARWAYRAGVTVNPRVPVNGLVLETPTAEDETWNSNHGLTVGQRHLVLVDRCKDPDDPGYELAASHCVTELPDTSVLFEFWELHKQRRTTAAPKLGMLAILKKIAAPGPISDKPQKPPTAYDQAMEQHRQKEKLYQQVLKPQYREAMADWRRHGGRTGFRGALWNEDGKKRPEPPERPEKPDKADYPDTRFGRK